MDTMIVSLRPATSNDRMIPRRRPGSMTERAESGFSTSPMEERRHVVYLVRGEERRRFPGLWGKVVLSSYIGCAGQNSASDRQCALRDVLYTHPPSLPPRKTR